MSTIKNLFVGTAVAATTALLSGVALADKFTLRIGSGHPNGPAVYVTVKAVSATGYNWPHQYPVSQLD